MKSVTEFARFRTEGQPISMVTCYDAWSAKLIAKADIDAVLVGDSVAMVVHGYPSTVHATPEMMVLHTAAVRRGLGDRFLVADFPFPEHRKGIPAAVEMADQLLKAGANAVKIEGAEGHLDVIRHLVVSGVPVMGHLGLTPQSIHQMGGYRVQAREKAAAAQLIKDAKALAEAGVFSLVLECIPMDLATEVTREIPVPTIGIGSGSGCSGQILVLQDLLGMDPDFHPKFVRTYAEGGPTIRAALDRYKADVAARTFPSASESFQHAALGKH
jgi:3-methyl-2-oxobutanoate hydroxymethyltransferase